MPIITCHKVGCEKEATHAIGLDLSPDGDHYAKSTPILLVCKEHSEGLKFEDVCGPDGWKQILENFAANHIAAPKKQYSKLLITELPKTH